MKLPCSYSFLRQQQGGFFAGVIGVARCYLQYPPKDTAKLHPAVAVFARPCAHDKIVIAAACHFQMYLPRRAGKVGEFIAVAFLVKQLEGVIAHRKVAGHGKSGGAAFLLRQLAVVENLVRITIGQHSGNVFVRAGYRAGIGNFHHSALRRDDGGGAVNVQIQVGIVQHGKFHRAGRYFRLDKAIVQRRFAAFGGRCEEDRCQI